MFSHHAIASGLEALGLGLDRPWAPTFAIAFGWTLLMLAYSPIADYLASRWVAERPRLEAFRRLQHGLPQLIAGVVIAWALGAFLEEFVFRALILRSLRAVLAAWLPAPAAISMAVALAALGAGAAHVYQGARGVVIITQLSVLFGALYVISGYNFWAVALCHGFYDTIAFVRFAFGYSKYARADRPAHE